MSSLRSSSSLPGKEALVRVADESLTRDQVSEFASLCKKVVAQKSALLDQVESRKLEHKYSKIVDSYSRHLPKNVRVMKPFETLFAGLYLLLFFENKHIR